MKIWKRFHGHPSNACQHVWYGQKWRYRKTTQSCHCGPYLLGIGEIRHITVIHFLLLSPLGKCITRWAGVLWSLGNEGQGGLHCRGPQLAPWNRQQTDGKNQATGRCQSASGTKKGGLFLYHLIGKFALWYFEDERISSRLFFLSAV